MSEAARSPAEVPFRNASTTLWLAAVAAASLGVFVLPWHFAAATPLPGESYVLGFNNRLGVCALGVGLMLAWAARMVSPNRQTAIEWIANTPDLLPRWGSAKAEHLLWIGWSALWANALWMWGSYLVDPAWCEARAFHYGLDMMASGHVPYRDFMFNYGPATLYVPYWLSVLSGGDLSFEASYLVVLILFTVAGFGCLFLLLRALAIPSHCRAIALALALLAWGEVNMGLNGVPLRFLLAPASLVLVHMVMNRAIHGAGEWRTAAASAGATLACFAMSPEMGIAVAVALLSMGLCRLIAGKRQSAFACWSGCLVMLGGTYAIVPDYFLSVSAFASGGHNFPIYANAHNVALVAMSLFVLPALIASAFRAPADDRSALAMGLAVVGGMLLPAAFGRCDPGHIFHDGIVPMLLVFPAVVRWKKVWQVAAVATYVLLYVFLLQFSYWSYYTNNFVAAMQMRAFYEQNPQLVETWRQKWDALKARHPRGQYFHWSSVLPYPDDLDEFTTQGPVLLVAGNEWNLWLARYLVLQKEFPRDYFHAYSQGAATPSQIERKVRESKEAKFLMIPEFVLAPLAGPIDLEAYGKGLDRFLSGLLFFPVRTTVKHPPFFPDSEIAKQLLEDYRTVFKYQGYVVAERKPTAGKRDSEKPARTDTDNAP